MEKQEQKKEKRDKSDTIKKRIEKEQQSWLEAFKNTWTVAAACLKIGIVRNTFYEWAKKYPEFLKQKREIEKEQIEYVESKLIRAIEDGNLGAIIFYLKCRSKKWRPYEKRELEGKIKSPELQRIAESLIKIAERKYDNKADAPISDIGRNRGGEEDSPRTL